MPLRRRPCLASWLLLLNGFWLVAGDYTFTQAHYNATIPENSLGNTFARSEEKMGFYLPAGVTEHQQPVVRFRIVDGDPRGLFKAEARLVGDFYFLLLRTRTSHQSVLNREEQDSYLLKIKASISSATGGESNLKSKAKTEVLVSVLDTNDLSPLFSAKEYNVSVPEDTPLHQQVTVVDASDADIGLNGEIYYSFLQPTLQFAVHPTRGSITLTRPLDAVEQNLHLLTLVAEDRGPKFRSSVNPTRGRAAALLRVHVIPVNLHAPEIFVSSFQSLQTSRQSGGAVCAVVKVLDRDQGPHGQIGSLTIFAGDPDGLFRVAPGPTANEFAIEVNHNHTNHDLQQEFTLTLKAQDKGLPPRSSTKIFHLRLTDGVESAPMFDKPSYEVSVLEVVPVNTPILQLIASRPTMANKRHSSLGDIIYHLEGGSPGSLTAFHLNSQTGQLTTARPLDHETWPHYTLTVTAMNRGIGGLSHKSSVQVQVTVLDANDNDPVFNASSVTVTFDENRPVGSIVYTAKAKDIDAGENGYISYSLANLNYVPFSVDHFTGDVRTVEKIDYETHRRHYLLKVRASDWGAPYRRQAELSLHIRINDVNDHRPQFEKVDCKLQVVRKAPIGTHLLTLSAVDFDAGALVTYRMVPTNDDPCFSLDASSGLLSLTCDLSKQLFREKSINVSATDGRHFADTMPIDLKIVSAGVLPSDQTVSSNCRDAGVTSRLREQYRLGELNNRGGGMEDDVTEPTPTRFTENRHAPEFSVTLPLEISIYENASVGSVVLIASAHDADHGFNGQVVHAISSGDEGGRFRLDLYSGSLLVERALDREKQARYALNLTAFDLGTPQKSVSRMLAVQLLDVNDNVPTFEKSSYSFLVTENTRNGSSIVRLHSTDGDDGVNAKMLYDLVTDTEGFSVDPLSGVVSVKGPLDREAQEVYELLVRVTDGCPERPLSSTTLVTVRLEDENDNAPQFGLPQYSVQAREDLPVGTVLLTLLAKDPDLGSGGVVRYALLEDSDLPFSMDPMTGVLRLADHLDFEKKRVYNLTVKAVDRGEPNPLWSLTSILVEVEDVNENLHVPLFSDFVVEGVVAENLPVGTSVLSVLATDGDPPDSPDSAVVYSIRDGTGLGSFSIDEQGNIRTRVVLDAEAQSYYWLTVYAQDRGAIPLSSALQVFIKVEDVNDNAPLTHDPIYEVYVSEEVPPGTSLLQMTAFDRDHDDQSVTWSLQPPNNPNFKLTPNTGVLSVGTLPLDRETQAEHVLEVIVKDNGVPPLESLTRVIITVRDVNDNPPKFDKTTYRIEVPEMDSQDKFVPLCQVLAKDSDEGANGAVEYSLANGSTGLFSIAGDSGQLLSRGPLVKGDTFELIVQARDGGTPPLFDNTRLFVSVVGITESPNAPVLSIDKPQVVQVAEGDPIGHLVTLIEAHDPDGDNIYFSITGGDPGNHFMIQSKLGAVFLAKLVDWETQPNYNLTIKVTDGSHSIYNMLYVQVLDTNEHAPKFSQRSYMVTVPENARVGSKILQLSATDMDKNKKLSYSIHNSASPASMELFKVDSDTGTLSVASTLDFEAHQRHILTVEVRDQGTPVDKRDYARVLISLEDQNDHPPEFLSPVFEAQVFETSPVGSSVLQLLAIDRDKGHNAIIQYSITSGNVGSAFELDAHLGLLRVSKPLDRKTMAEYFLVVQASNPISSTSVSPAQNGTSVTIHLVIRQADDAPPTFEKELYSSELYENEPVATSVTVVNAQSPCSLHYEILSGNDKDAFIIDPISGLVRTQVSLDYEEKKFYNLTIQASNMRNKKAVTVLSVHVLDRNDNPPTFDFWSYSGWISESALLGSFVLGDDNNPLVLSATDMDSQLNGLLQFEIVEKSAKKLFDVDTRTGAVTIVTPLDHESTPFLQFHVSLSDLGRPRLNAPNTALVNVTVRDVNDCAPVFKSGPHEAVLLLPTYRGVAVAQVTAQDQDSTVLRYSILTGNEDLLFFINSTSGLISVRNAPAADSGSEERTLVLVSDDGQFESSTTLRVIIRQAQGSGLRFAKNEYSVQLLEDVKENVTLCVLTVLGTALNEQVTFRMLNPNPLFEVGPTSGQVRTRAGGGFDRERSPSYTLVLEARGHGDYVPPKIAHALLEVTLEDVNDNKPMFVHLPYSCVVAVDAQPGDLVLKVQAIDLDVGLNGLVHYQLAAGVSQLTADMFTVDGSTGSIYLKKVLGSHNDEYVFTVRAQDNGTPSLSSEASVQVKVINRNMPVFPQQYYAVSVPENVPAHSPVLTLQASSPQGRQLIYSILAGNTLEEFGVDFNTEPGPSSGPCILFVNEALDYETSTSHLLTLRATDSVSGAYNEVKVNVTVEDVNDNAPVFLQPSYSVPVSESIPFGSSIAQVSATDRDSKQHIQYHFENNKNYTSLFHIDSNEGIVFLKQQLDRESMTQIHLVVVATDGGSPILSGTAHLWVNVEDANDHWPQFEHATYSCAVSEIATRGHFVVRVVASDLDSSDNGKLQYAIIGGNEMQVFAINSSTGVIRLANSHHFGGQTMHFLNVSVSDGVHSSHARVRVDVLGANRHSPVFTRTVYEAAILENLPAGTPVATVSAVDGDKGEYGHFTYSIQSQLASRLFSINPRTGELRTQALLDRESQSLYEIPVAAVDTGGRLGYCIVRVTVTDVNDHVPQFSVAEYKAIIYANTTIGTTVLKIDALDADEGLSGSLEFSIYDRSDQALFGITHDSGEVYLQRAIPETDGSSGNQAVHQFFVRARDRGSPRQESHVPVSVWVQNSEPLPTFEESEFTFFLPERSPIGTVVTTLNVTGYQRLSFASAPADSPAELQVSCFSIDPSGRIQLMSTLDRETVSSYHLTVLAETENHLVSSARLIIHIMDENDNAPVFESDNYHVKVAENSPKGTSLLRVKAWDADLGRSSEVTYTLADNYDGVFNLDSKSGWLILAFPLDRETRSEYNLSITATDDGPVPLMSYTRAHVQVLDYNDNPPVFRRQRFTAAIYENALPGTVLLPLETQDADSDAFQQQEFYIIEGNPKDQFWVRKNGELFVNKPLDREEQESYLLEVLATDGTFTATTQVFVDILDVNDNPPVCLRSQYTEMISESITPQSFVLTVEVRDADQDGRSQVEFLLSGQGAQDFYINGSSGLGFVKTAKPLDRERQSHYSLVVHVRDPEGQPEWQCSVALEISLSDVNDNSPVFSQDILSVTVLEDSLVGTVVAKVHATDPDLGINRKISYAFVDSAHGHFSIDSNTGIVKLQKPLDRETTPYYNLSVQARDHGTPHLSSLANLLVLVQDINDNPPEFSQVFYYERVSETAAVGSEVLRVLATSKDSGINAEITYSIVEDSEQHSAFTIHPKSGIISVAKTLDFEQVQNYFVSVLAKDGGTPSLSAQVAVNISVIDANDNAPVFSQSIYYTLIQEDALPGDKILQVFASDADSKTNSILSYSIVPNNIIQPEDIPFVIDSDTGTITLSSGLDRETRHRYVLQVECRDSGTPALSAVATINVEVSDVNDNPPLFSKTNYTVIVQEGRPLGFTILKFLVTDLDAPPNAGPFKLEILSGNEDMSFRLVQQDGTLRTAALYDHNKRSHYQLHVRAWDKGQIPLSSDAFVNIRIIEESKYPPLVLPLEVLVVSYLDDFPGGALGRLHASDEDPYDKLSFDIVSYHAHLFSIGREDGLLVAQSSGLDVGTYNVNISVTDGKFTTFGNAKVQVVLASEEAVQNSLVLSFGDVTPEDFLLTHRKPFMKGLQETFRASTKVIEILSVQPSSNRRGALTSTSPITPHSDLDVLFAVRAGGGRYHPPHILNRKLRDKWTTLQSLLGLKITQVTLDRCGRDTCVHGECQEKMYLEPTNPLSIALETYSFVCPQHYQRAECNCQAGYGGNACENVVNACAHSSCPVAQVCSPEPSAGTGYICHCPPGKGGPACQQEIATTCNSSSDTCRTPMKSFMFKGNSYARYSLVNQIDRHLKVSLRVRTKQPTFNLMFGTGLRDYFVLEVVNGLLRFRFDCGSGEGIVRVEQTRLDDGNWHQVELERHGNTAKLTLDNHGKALGSSPGVHDILNLDGNDVYFGAEVRTPPVQGHEDIRMGLNGCLQDMRVEGVPLPTSSAVSVTTGSTSLGTNAVTHIPVATLKRLKNVEFQCQSLVDPGACGSQPCLNGATCLSNSDSHFVCRCLPRFKGPLCETDTDPCASSPCLNGATCHNLNGDFHCQCPGRLSGKRCDYGRYCVLTACMNGAACEEGSTGPVCKCRGYQGDRCQYDLDECQVANPCAAGSTCLNLVGSFQCICPPNVTGATCSEHLYTTSITSSAWNTTVEEIIGIAMVVVFILFLAFLLACCWRIRHKRQRPRPNNEIRDDPAAGEFLMKNPVHQDKVQRHSKVSNLEATLNSHHPVHGRQSLGHHSPPPVVPPRPVSYTPLTQEGMRIAMNRFDTLQSYGSAGKDLETPELLQNLSKPSQMTTNNNSSSTPSVKYNWENPASKHNLYEEKIQNDMKPPPKPQGKQVTCDTSLLSVEDGGERYHWDCSDWAPQKPSSTMTKVSLNELRDSSSQSGESNSQNSQIELLPSNHHQSMQQPGTCGAVGGHYTTSSQEDDLDLLPGGALPRGKHSPPLTASSLEDVMGASDLEYADDGIDSLPSSPMKYTPFHPNNYLPVHQQQRSSEAGLSDLDDYLPSSSEMVGGHLMYGDKSEPLSTDLTRTSGVDSLCGSTSASCSDIFGNVCEIDDSEAAMSDLESTNQLLLPGEKRYSTTVV